MEQVSNDMRATITSLAFTVWTFGMCLLPLAAWITRDWILLGVITSAPYFALSVTWWFFPESPRWLVSRGKIEESAKVFKQIAKYNRISVPQDLSTDLEKIVELENLRPKSIFSYLSFLELFQYPVITKRILLLTICYSCNSLLYYAIVFNNNNLGGNEFLNFFYLSISELPGNAIAWFCSQNFGRKYSEAGFFLLATLTASAAIFTPNASMAQVIICVTCKTLANISFLIVYIQMVEILPTSHRSCGTGFTSLTSSIITITTPYIAYSGKIWPSMPYVILTCIGSTGAITALFLPETLGESLPQTIEDSENLAKGQPLCYYSGWIPFRKKRLRDFKETSV